MKYTHNQIRDIELLTGIKKRNYLHEKDLVSHLTGLLLAEYGLYTLMGECADKIENNAGKPRYRGADTKYSLQFNISHSEDIVVCAISVAKVGIDIEKIKIFPKEIAEHIFDVEEQKYCQNNNRFAYKLWTRKESYLKATGEGISGLKKVGSFVQKQKIIDYFDGYKFREVFIDGKYETVVCLEESEIINIMEINEKCLTKYMEMCTKRKLF